MRDALDAGGTHAMNHSATRMTDREMLERSRYVRAVGDWLREHAWDYFVTLSFRIPVTETVADRLFESVWARRLAWRARRALQWARVTCGGSPEERIHVHALYYACGTLSADALSSAWEF